MAEFETFDQYHQFAQFVMSRYRHLLDAKNTRFLEAVLTTSKRRKHRISKASGLWRAQLGYSTRLKVILDPETEKEVDSFEVETAYPPERMSPRSDRASEGRVNPKGIPCLYCSTDKETAMMEVRPWDGSYVSLAQLVVLKELTVVDCTLDSRRWSPFLQYSEYQPTAEEKEGYVWGDINRALSKPVTRNDDVAEYAPTQVLAELFRQNGIDGIIYGSNLGTGKTVALFDVKAAELVTCQLCRVDEIRMKFSSLENPYFIVSERNSDDEEADSGPEPLC